MTNLSEPTETTHGSRIFMDDIVEKEVGQED
ncbi:hypothetical protein ES703_07085 [subsurface metagenome]